MSQEQFEYEVMREEYEELRMMEWAEDIIDRTREDQTDERV